MASYSQLPTEEEGEGGKEGEATAATTAAPPPGTTGRINCSGCRTLLAYPPGAYSVHCPKCGTLTAAQQLASVQWCVAAALQQAQLPHRQLPVSP